MIHHQMPGEPAKVRADMGSDNAGIVHKHGGKLSGNQYKVLNHIAWTAYDREGIPKGAKGRDGNPAKPLQFFGRAQDHALIALGRSKSPADTLKLWERAVRSLVDLGVLRRIERAIPHKRTALFELNLSAMEKLGIDVDLDSVSPVDNTETGHNPSPETGDASSPVLTETGDASSPEGRGDWAPKVPPYLQASTTQVEFSNQKSRLTTRSRRTVSSPRAREPKLLANSSDDSSAYDKASRYLLDLSPERHEHVMEEARKALGADAPVQARVIHAAQLAGLPEVQEREAS